MATAWNPDQALDVNDDTARQEQFLALLEAHRGILHKVARAYCANPADREDLVQETVVQLWRSFEGYDPGARFSTWMYRVALNVAISFVRREDSRARRAPRGDAALLEELPAREPEPRGAELERLERAIERLEDFDKALVLLYLDGHEHATIAELLGISVSNVGTRLSRLRARLAENLRAARAAEGRHS